MSDQTSIPTERARGTPVRRRWLSFAARLIVCAGLVALLCWWTDLREVGRVLASTDTRWFGLTCAIALFDRTLMAYKWTRLLACRGIHVTLWEATRLYFIGHIIGTFTPGAIGADAYRVAVLNQRGPTSVLLSTVLLERLIGVAVVGIVAGLMLPVSARYLAEGATAVVWTTLVVGVVGAGCVVASLHPPTVEALGRRVPFLGRTRLAQKLRDFYGAYAEFRAYPGALFSFTLLTVLELYTLIALNYCAARSVGVDVSFTYFLAVMPLLHVLVRLPVSFQGVGVQEGLFAYFLVAVGFSAAQGLSVSLVHRALEVVCVMLPGALLLWLVPARASLGKVKA